MPWAARGAFSGLGGHDEKEQTLNQLLSEMDGFDASVGLIILSATNRPEILDPALLRADRFDRQVLVDRPDRKCRVDILRVHVRKVRLDAAVERIVAGLERHNRLLNTREREAVAFHEMAMRWSRWRSPAATRCKRCPPSSAPPKTAT